MKGRPCASASRRLLFQSIQAWRSCLRPSWRPWRPSWRPFWRPSSSPSRRSRSRCGLSHFSSRYLFVTMMKPPPASNTVTIISEYMIISDSADALVRIMAIIVSTALSCNPLVISLHATSAVQPIVRANIRATHQCHQVLATVRMDIRTSCSL